MSTYAASIRPRGHRAPHVQVARPAHAAPRIVLTPDVVDVWGADSFPASDPPSNW